MDKIKIWLQHIVILYITAVHSMANYDCHYVQSIFGFLVSMYMYILDLSKIV